MSWNKQMEETVGTWTEMQHKMWENWSKAVNTFGGQSGPGGEGSEAWKQEYRKNLEAWEASVRQALDAQSQWAHSWADKVAIEETPEVMSQWVQQVQTMMGGWTQAQSQLWNAWFDSVRGLDPSQVASRWDTEGQQVLEAWREAAERAQETLADWSRLTATTGAPVRPDGGSGDGEPAKAKAKARPKPKAKKQ